MALVRADAWERLPAGDNAVQQGDIIARCIVPDFPPDLARYTEASGEPAQLDAREHQVIVVSQTCDLVERKNRRPCFVAVCPILTWDELAASDPAYDPDTHADGSKRQSALARIKDAKEGKSARILALLLPEPGYDRAPQVCVDFGQIYSLPYDHVVERARKTIDRLRLKALFREAFSQAFGVYYMRVALPDPPAA